MTHIKFKEIEVGETFLYRGEIFVKCETSDKKSSFAVVKTEQKNANILPHLKAMQNKSNAFTTELDSKFGFFGGESLVERTQ